MDLVSLSPKTLSWRAHEVPPSVDIRTTLSVSVTPVNAYPVINMVSRACAGELNSRKMQATGRREGQRFMRFARGSSTWMTRDDGSMELSGNCRRSILTQTNQELRIRSIVSHLNMIHYINIIGDGWVGHKTKQPQPEAGACGCVARVRERIRRKRFLASWP